MKEGVKNGDEYDVFEQRFDTKSNKTNILKLLLLKLMVRKKVYGTTGTLLLKNQVRKKV